MDLSLRYPRPSYHPRMDSDHLKVISCCIWGMYMYMIPCCHFGKYIQDLTFLHINSKHHFVK